MEIFGANGNQQEDLPCPFNRMSATLETGLLGKLTRHLFPLIMPSLFPLIPFFHDFVEHKKKGMDQSWDKGS